MPLYASVCLCINVLGTRSTTFTALTKFFQLYASRHLCLYASMSLCLYASAPHCRFLYVSMSLCLYASMPLCLYVSMSLCFYASMLLGIFSMYFHFLRQPICQQRLLNCFLWTPEAKNKPILCIRLAAMHCIRGHKVCFESPVAFFFLFHYLFIFFARVRAGVGVRVRVR